jgi:hypothetical protein
MGFTPGRGDLSGDEFGGYKRKIIALSNSAAAVTRTLLASETGALVTIDPGSGTSSRTIAITMPAPEAGLFFDFVILTDAGDNTNDISWTTGDNAVDIRGIFQVGNIDPNDLADYSGTSMLQLSADVSKITIDVSINYGALNLTTLTGTSFQLTTDGSHWYPSGAVINGNWYVLAPIAGGGLGGLVQSTTA